jgi:peroxiredoxin family protein
MRCNRSITISNKKQVLKMDMEKRIEELEKQVSQLKDTFIKFEKNADENKLTMIVFSGDLDKALAAFIIATGAVAMGMEVIMFFTFWGTPLLRKPDGKSSEPKDAFGKMFGAMLPKGAPKASLSKMNMGGMGTAMMKHLMKKKNVATLDEMIALAAELEVKIYICEMSMDLMGFSRDEMIDFPDLGYAGVATFLSEAGTSKAQLFI